MTNIFEEVQIKARDAGGFTHTITLKSPEGTIHILDKPFEAMRTLADIKLHSNSAYTLTAEFTGDGEDFFVHQMDERHIGLWASFKTGFKDERACGKIVDFRSAFRSDYCIKLEGADKWQHHEGVITLFLTEEGASKHA